MKRIILSVMAILGFCTRADAQSDMQREDVEVGIAVDLGLPSGTLWADHNIGATNPEDCGSYYAWGEIEIKSDYDWSTYKWCDGSDDTQTKYCTDSSKGTIDDKTELDDADDIAVQLWGGAWRMPTKDQLDELRNGCDWEWTSVNGINGYMVKSRVNGNYIFLPAAGGRWATSIRDEGDNGSYRSRSLCVSNSSCAYYMFFDSNTVDWYGDYRYFGFSVRPVCHGE